MELTRLKEEIRSMKRQLLVVERMRFEALKNRKASSSRWDAQLFAGGVAHEFNNILGAVDGHAEWALSTGDSTDMREALVVIRQACARSSEITQALQGLSQPEEDKKKIFALQPVLKEWQDLLRARVRSLKGELEFVCPELQIYGNPARLLEILLNLSKNSLDAMEKNVSPGSKVTAPLLKLVGKRHGRGLQLIHQDNGPGVPQIYRDLIFQPFFTTKGSYAAAASTQAATSASGKGSGLGLYLARSWIQEMGGTLKLLKSPSGAKFELRLPVVER